MPIADISMKTLFIRTESFFQIREDYESKASYLFLRIIIGGLIVINNALLTANPSVNLALQFERKF